VSSAELYLGPPPEDSEFSSEPQYHVRLEEFDGPIELLLHLIRKNEYDIYDIPIAAITRQYLDMIELMKELNLNVAGDFVFMSATLIHIKSKMLLPPPHEDGTEDEDWEDPRAELVARLLEYQKYKEAAQLLRQKELVRNAMWTRPESAVAEFLEQKDELSEDLVDVDLFELVIAFREVLTRIKQRRDFTVKRDAVTLDEMIARLRARVKPGDHLTFEQLFEDVTTREMLIVTFLALLELVRLKVLRVYQKKNFSTIHVRGLEPSARASASAAMSTRSIATADKQGGRGEVPIDASAGGEEMQSRPTFVRGSVGIVSNLEVDSEGETGGGR
jgi:segregation and condensation protein A